MNVRTTDSEGSGLGDQAVRSARVSAEQQWRDEVESWRWRVMWVCGDGAGTSPVEYRGTEGLKAAHAEVVRLHAENQAHGDQWGHVFMVVHSGRSDWRLYVDDTAKLAAWSAS